MIDFAYWRSLFVNDILPRRLKLAVVATGIINRRRYRQRALDIAHHNSKVDIHRLTALLDKKDYRNAWRTLYRPVVGDDIDAIPEIDYYCLIEPALNHVLYGDLIDSQKDYRSLGLDFPVVPTLGFIRGGRLYTTNQMNAVPVSETGLAGVPIEPDRDYFIKPSGADSGSGHGTSIVPGRDLFGRLGALSRISRLLMIQPVLLGHEFFRSLNPSSLNSLRCMTFMEGGRARALSAVLRVGRAGQVVDNFSSGGIAIGVDERGRLRDYAIDDYLRTYRRHPDSGMPFAGLEIPSYRSMVDVCVKAHSGLRNLGVLSWDVALSRDGRPVIIDLNVINQGINLHQANNPGSLLPLSPYRSGLLTRMKRVWSRYPSNSDLRAIEAPTAVLATHAI